jgi:hypothetical protein
MSRESMLGWSGSARSSSGSRRRSRESVGGCGAWEGLAAGFGALARTFWGFTARAGFLAGAAFRGLLGRAVRALTAFRGLGRLVFRACGFRRPRAEAAFLDFFAGAFLLRRAEEGRLAI